MKLLILCTFTFIKKMKDDASIDTIIDPTISKGKWTPQKTLATPPISESTSSINPDFLVSAKQTNINAIENRKVVWSDGKDVSGACEINNVPIFIIKGLGWKYKLAMIKFNNMPTMAEYDDNKAMFL